MMTSSEAARKRRMTGMPDRQQRWETRRRPGSCTAPRGCAARKGGWREQQNFTVLAVCNIENKSPSEPKAGGKGPAGSPRRGQAGPDRGQRWANEGVLLPVLPHRFRAPHLQGAPESLPGWSLCETRGNRNYRSPAHTITLCELILLFNELRCYSSNFCTI